MFLRWHFINFYNLSKKIVSMKRQLDIINNVLKWELFFNSINESQNLN